MGVFTLDSPNCAVACAASYPWFALRVRSNFEKTAAVCLRDRGYEEFLPQYRTLRQWSDRKKQIDVPLFPGYIFARFDSAKLSPILDVPGVVNIVSAGSRPIPVDDAELAAVAAVVRSGCPAGPWPYLREGQGVTITHGALSGLTGILLQIKNQYRLVVSVSMLMRSVAVEIDRAWVSPSGRQSAADEGQARRCVPA